MPPSVNFDHLIVASNRLPVTIERSRRGPQRAALQRRPRGRARSRAARARRDAGSGGSAAPEHPPTWTSATRSRRSRSRRAKCAATTRAIRTARCGRCSTPFPSAYGSIRATGRPTTRSIAASPRRSRSALGPRDLVWIHDYHLLRCALHLRELRPDARIALFVHIPFPPFDVYRVLPQYRELLRGMLACDLVGFHCPGYVSNFLDCVERLLGERVDHGAGRVEHGARTVQVGAFPLGIDYAAFEKRAREAPPGERGARADHPRRRPPRLHQGHPRAPARVRAPARAPPRAPRQRGVPAGGGAEPAPGDGLPATEAPDRRAGRPRERALRRAALDADPLPLPLGRSRPARGALPRRGGRARDAAARRDESGGEGVRRVPGRGAGRARALAHGRRRGDDGGGAARQSVQRRRRRRGAAPRAARCRPRIASRACARSSSASATTTCLAWCNQFLDAAAAPARTLAPVGPEDFERWIGPLARRWPLVVFLDYDGTLAEIAPHPTLARLSTSMRDALAACAARGDTELVIVSGRALGDVRAMVDVPDLVLRGQPRARDRGARHGSVPPPRPRALRRARAQPRARAHRDLHRRRVGRGEGRDADAALPRRGARPAGGARATPRAR